MGIKFSNNASANIIRALTSTATSVSVTAGKGDLFPSLTEGDYFYATLAGNNGLEIVKVTNRVNDTMTIVRAQDNTTALSFDTGDLFELRIVAADFNDTFTEVNDKLEASIEETASIVESALSSKAPIFHASSTTEFGTGSSTQYGHVKTHDAPDATLTAATGHAFSPAGAAAMQDALEGQIGDLAGVVSGNTASQAARDSQQDAAIQQAQTAASNAINGAVTSAVIDGLDLVLTYGEGTTKRVPLPTGKGVGDMWFGVDPKSKPANVQAYSGQLLSRSAYPAHWAFVNGGNRTVISESQWQAQVSANGFCPYYSSGDDSTTYRMPSLKGVHPKFVAALAEAGGYTAAGLPNITGTLRTVGAGKAGLYLGGSTGAFANYDDKTSTQVYNSSGSSSCYRNANFDASLSNPIYGASNTVQPPAVNIILGEYVVGAVAAIGEANATSLLASVTRLESEVANKIGRSATDKAEVIGWGMPDYSATINLGSSTSYTAPKAGYAFITGSRGSVNDQQWTIKVNGNSFALLVAWTGSWAGSTYQVTVPVQKGDVLTDIIPTTVDQYSNFFVPLRGV